MSEQGRATILAMLRSAGDQWVSGEEISTRLGISRTAVWKQIEALRTAGYEVEAQTRLGYRVVSSPDSVNPSELRSALTTQRLGHQIEYRESVGSTNELAKQLARTGAPEGLLVVAEEQTAGKGRLGRSWATPKGSAVAMSLLLRPRLAPHQAPRLTLAAAVAVTEAIRTVTGLPAGIKWPNDILVRGRKCCGILTEMEADPDTVHFAVCGIGVNVNLATGQIPDELRTTATSLLAEGGTPINRPLLIAAILTRFEEAYDHLLSDRFDIILDRWRHYSVTLGQAVWAVSAVGAPPIEGLAEEIDAEGALLIRTPTGERHRLMSGEVSIRPIQA